MGPIEEALAKLGLSLLTDETATIQAYEAKANPAIVSAVAGFLGSAAGDIKVPFIGGALQDAIKAYEPQVTTLLTEGEAALLADIEGILKKYSGS